MTNLLIISAVLAAVAFVFSVGVIVGWNRGRESADVLDLRDRPLDVTDDELIDLTDSKPAPSGWINPRPMH